MPIGIIVDIDDTLVDTDERRWTVWRNVLGREIPLEEVERLGSRQILDIYGFGDKKVWERYWSILLCWENVGNELFKLNKPIPFARQVLQKWNEEYKLIYLTGRSRNIYDLTLDELDRFGFPTTNIDLVMLRVKDWESYFASKTSHVELRTNLFTSIYKRYNIEKVLDDYPINFTIYKRFKIPDRIGLLRPKRFSKKDYSTQGATRVVTWKQLLENTWHR